MRRSPSDACMSAARPAGSRQSAAIIGGSLTSISEVIRSARLPAFGPVDARERCVDHVLASSPSPFSHDLQTRNSYDIPEFTYQSRNSVRVAVSGPAESPVSSPYVRQARRRERSASTSREATRRKSGVHGATLLGLASKHR